MPSVLLRSIHMAFFLQIGDKRNVMGEDSVKKGRHIIHHCCIIIGRKITIICIQRTCFFGFPQKGCSITYFCPLNFLATVAGRKWILCKHIMTKRFLIFIAIGLLNCLKPVWKFLDLLQSIVLPATITIWNPFSSYCNALVCEMYSVYSLTCA